MLSVTRLHQGTKNSNSYHACHMRSLRRVAARLAEQFNCKKLHRVGCELVEVLSHIGSYKVTEELLAGFYWFLQAKAGVHSQIMHGHGEH